MRIQRETSCYNQRRYGKPWIAKVVMTDGKLDYQWGQWIANQPGDDGLLVIDLEIGDFFARGQKDHRGRKPETNYYQLGADGKGVTITKVDVFRALSNPKTQEVSNV
jgi:hypothetical protein